MFNLLWLTFFNYLIFILFCGTWWISHATHVNIVMWMLCGLSQVLDISLVITLYKTNSPWFPGKSWRLNKFSHTQQQKREIYVSKSWNINDRATNTLYKWVCTNWRRMRSMRRLVGKNHYRAHIIEKSNCYYFLYFLANLFMPHQFVNNFVQNGL